MKVYVVIPAFNEEAVIADVITGVKKNILNAKVIVVNDKSTDNTSRMAHEATVINHILNQGAGGATSTGLRYAKLEDADWVITLDADGQHDPKDALKCLRYAQDTKSDLVIGSRLIDSKGMSRIKVLGNKGLTIITWLLFGVKVTDSQSGLRVFSKRALQTLEWESTGYDFCSEMIWRAKQAQLIITEFPIQAIYTDYSIRKGQNNWNAINIIFSLLKRRIVEHLK